MARDEEAEEREFLADLHTRTGRDLAQWMAAIAAQSFSAFSSRAMREAPSEPTACARLVGKILLAKARLQMPLLG